MSKKKTKELLEMLNKRINEVKSSDGFKKMLKLFSQFHNYSFHNPDDVVPGPYNVSFNDRKTKPTGTKKLSTQVMEKELDNYKKIVVLDGKNYVEMVRDVFPAKKILS